MSNIAIGQRFRSVGVTGKPAYTYEVQATFISRVDHREYVRLVEAGDPTRTKTLVISTLLDPRDFTALAPAGEGPPTPPSRGFGRAILDALR